MNLLALGLLVACDPFGEPPPLKPLPPPENPELPPVDTGTPPLGELRLAALEPSFGPDAGGTTVVLSGAFPEGVVVTFDDDRASLLDATPTSLTVETPPGTAGPVAVRVMSGDRFSLLDGAFSYFPDRSDRVGLVGEIRRNQIVGDYWADTAAPDGRARLAFVDLERWSLADAYGASGTCTYALEPTLDPASDVGAPLLTLTSTVAGPHELLPLEATGWFGVDLLDAETPPGTGFSLEPGPFAPPWPSFGLPDLATLPPAFAIDEPPVDAALPPSLTRTFELRWTGQGGDFMVLELTRALPPDGAQIIDTMRCTFPDDGGFTVDGNLWPDWYADEVMFIRLGRVVTSASTLPHDAARVRVAAVHFVEGAGLTIDP